MKQPKDQTFKRPFHYRITGQAQFDMQATARAFSRLLNDVVQIVDDDGAVVEVVDGRGDEPAAAAAVKTREAPGGRGVKQAKAIQMLSRKNGATAKELSAEMGWSMGEWHVKRIAKVTGRELVLLGDRHWRLEPAKQA